MKTLLSIILGLVLFNQNIGAQATMICPDDVIVKLVELDANLDYGTPTVNIPQPYNLTVTTETVAYNCNDIYYKTIKKTFLLAYGNNIDTCSQLISITRNEFSDYQAPADITLASGDPHNISPDITGYYGPVPGSDGIIAAAYEDLVIPLSNNGAKVLRSWVLLNWCDASTLEHQQIITIGLVMNSDLMVVTADGKEIGNYEYSLVDENGNLISNPNCGGNIIDEINCLYTENPNISSIEVLITKNEGYLNGVSTLDIVLTQKHILGITPLDDPFKMIAADVNSTNTISALDLIEMKKLILAITTEFQNAPSWRFFNQDLSSGLIFSNQELPLSDLIIIGVKTGDVNYSAAP